MFVKFLLLFFFIGLTFLVGPKFPQEIFSLTCIIFIKKKNIEYKIGGSSLSILEILLTIEMCICILHAIFLNLFCIGTHFKIRCFISSEKRKK